MTYTYRWPAGRKARVRKKLDPWSGQPCWAAGRPGGIYFSSDGWHFSTWDSAIRHATRPILPENALAVYDNLAARFGVQS